jgi:hypothetical protein
MAHAVTAHYDMLLEVEETVAESLDLAADQTITHETDETTRGTLNASSTPAATQCFSDSITLAGGGSATLDLTSLTGPAGVTVTFSGLTVQLAKFACPSDNVAAVLIQKDDANAYNLLGTDNASSETFEVLPGGWMGLGHNDGAEDVDATHKGVKFTGTVGDKIEVILVAG